MPVLSALGAQAVAVPTAVLSPHTGGLGTPAKLANPGFVNKAPAQVVEDIRAKLARAQDKLARIDESIAALG